MVAGYVFTPMLDSPGNDIRYLPGVPLARIAQACNRNALCVGFNSNGWIKFQLLPFSQWQEWTNEPCLGFYTKHAGNALLIDLLALLMSQTFLRMTNTWPDIAFFSLETRVREPGVSVAIPCFGDDLLS